MQTRSVLALLSQTHVAPQEFLALRHVLTPALAGRSCPADCYSPPGAPGDSSSSSSSSSRRVSRVPAALLAAGLSPRMDANVYGGTHDGGGVSGGRSGGCPPEDGALECGPPVWLVPEHVVLRLRRKVPWPVHHVVNTACCQSAAKLHTGQTNTS
jgi:hypothetical protein